MSTTAGLCDDEYVPDSERARCRVRGRAPTILNIAVNAAESCGSSCADASLDTLNGPTTCVKTCAEYCGSADCSGGDTDLNACARNSCGRRHAIYEPVIILS